MHFALVVEFASAINKVQSKGSRAILLSVYFKFLKLLKCTADVMSDTLARIHLKTKKRQVRTINVRSRNGGRRAHDGFKVIYRISSKRKPMILNLTVIAFAAQFNELDA